MCLCVDCVFGAVVATHKEFSHHKLTTNANMNVFGYAYVCRLSKNIKLWLFSCWCCRNELCLTTYYELTESSFQRSHNNRIPQEKKRDKNVFVKIYSIFPFFDSHRANSSIFNHQQQQQLNRNNERTKTPPKIPFHIAHERCGWKRRMARRK